MTKGKVWLVGAGPSDVGLFTIKGKQVLENADVVVYDKLVGQGILSLMPKDAKLIDVGKRANNHLVPQEGINKILLEEALKGNNVVRLKGGDPFLFGRGGEELELLVENDIPFEIVPGVTSAISVPAYNGIPVTHRDFCSSVHIITGHTKSSEKAEINYNALVALNGTLVFLMGVGALESICNGLIDAKMDKEMPAAILEKGTTSKQRRVVSTLEKLVEDSKKANIQTPAIIVVGKVCELANKFCWAEKRKLAGLRIVVTRPEKLSSTLTQKLLENGAEVALLPSIKTEPIDNNKELKNALENIKKYSWIILTSPTGVDVFFEKLREYEIDIRTLFGIKFGAIGNVTAKAIENRGIKVDFVPKKYNSVSFADEVKSVITNDDKVLIARAKMGSIELLEGLDKNQISYDDISSYDTNYITDNLAHVKELAENNDIDYVAFTSASTVTGFVNSIKKADYSNIKAICIGEQTANEAKKYSMKTYISKESTIDSMVDLLIELNGKECS